MLEIACVNCMIVSFAISAYHLLSGIESSTTSTLRVGISTFLRQIVGSGSKNCRIRDWGMKEGSLLLDNHRIGLTNRRQGFH